MSESDEAAKGRALSSPLRLRILRMCLHHARTNKEIADLLGINPASCLHHVRTLVATGFLEAQPERRGARGAKEVPYLATRKSWSQHVDDVSPILIETFVQETAALPPEDITVWRLGLKLNEQHRNELMDKLRAVVDEYVAMPTDPDGEATSLMIAHHRDPTAD
ncbi:ArsR family transcriptional regulator [Sinomonas cyclohexanicum]|uniref:ArsR family transcriptional regulator n=1 Tax=Sinomonas cyclohexanicum TaxID=322009 RepID=A0ABN6FJR7_SINCY|nr:helix-turn-helix domain-containing protein [Corynebacterium cyclohexanicum]BCT76909.1 ArsR family transcriptional regulator [Corynebacterium cyclohexanicum]